MSKLMLYILVVVLMLLPAAALANTYEEKCAICHGVSGISKLPTVPGLSVTKLTADQIVSIIENGRGKMPKINLDDVQKKEVVEYIINSIKK